MDNQNDKLLNHEYDGIQELDNHLPMWWLWTFFGAIIFSFIYWIHYSLVKDGPSLDEELARDMARIEQLRKKTDGSDIGAKEISDEERLALGKSLFNANCASCHKQDGGGSVGPNLTDNDWVHGPTKEAIKKVVEEGVLDKGMPPWKGILRPNEVVAVVQFVESLKGKNVANGKAPQGEKVD